MTISEFEKMELGDMFEYNGELFVISRFGIKGCEPYIVISEIEFGDGVETADTPVQGTEYMLFYSEAKNQLYSTTF